VLDVTDGTSVPVFLSPMHVNAEGPCTTTKPWQSGVDKHSTRQCAVASPSVFESASNKNAVTSNAVENRMDPVTPGALDAANWNDPDVSDVDDDDDELVEGAEVVDVTEQKAGLNAIDGTTVMRPPTNSSLRDW
jgi:hypothetical protein